MVKLDAKSAADRIRMEVLGRPDISAEARHTLAFVSAVCEELGLESDPPNMQAVAAALQKADIHPHFVEEYPKMLTDDKGKPVRHGEDGPIVVFNDAAEEKNYKSGATGATGATGAHSGNTGATGPASGATGATGSHEPLPKALEYPKPLLENGKPVRDFHGVPIVFLDASEEKDYHMTRNKRMGGEAAHDNKYPLDVVHEDTDERAPKPRKK